MLDKIDPIDTLDLFALRSQLGNFDHFPLFKRFWRGYISPAEQYQLATTRLMARKLMAEWMQNSGGNERLNVDWGGDFGKVVHSMTWTNTNQVRESIIGSTGNFAMQRYWSIGSEQIQAQTKPAIHIGRMINAKVCFNSSGAITSSNLDIGTFRVTAKTSQDKCTLQFTHDRKEHMQSTSGSNGMEWSTAQDKFRDSICIDKQDPDNEIFIIHQGQAIILKMEKGDKPAITAIDMPGSNGTPWELEL